MTAAGDGLTARWGRRAATIPAYAAAFVALVALSPVLVPVAALSDVVRGTRFAATRLVLFGLVFLAAEMLGLVAIAVVGVTSFGSPARALAWNRSLQIVWARALLAAAIRLFGLRLDVDGDDDVPPGPVLVLARHVSVADTLLPTALLSHRHRLALRFVLKRELLWDPCLDLVGHRLPNAFVRRASPHGAAEIARIHALARDLGPGEGVLIYPEGTRATAAKLAAARARLAATDRERLGRLGGLRCVLPPHAGGTLALLDACPTADVLFLMHAGLEGASRARDALAGTLVGRTVRVAFRRVEAAAIPRSPAERARWLDAEWARVDAWVTSAEPPDAAPDCVGGACR